MSTDFDVSFKEMSSRRVMFPSYSSLSKSENEGPSMSSLGNRTKRYRRQEVFTFGS